MTAERADWGARIERIMSMRSYMRTYLAFVARGIGEDMALLLTSEVHAMTPEQIVEFVDTVNA